MFQINNRLLTKPLRDLSTAVCSVGSVASEVPTFEYPVPNLDHLESRVFFKIIENSGNFTRTVVFAGTITHIIDPTTTRIYDIRLNCALNYRDDSADEILNSLIVNLIVKPVNGFTLPITILPYTPVFDSNYYYKFFAIIGFTCGNSTIQANLRLEKTSREHIVDENFLNIEFYLAKPYLGTLRFTESLYTVYKNPNGLAEVTKLSGIIDIPNIGGYKLVLDSTREFETSTDAQAKFINSVVSIRIFDNSLLTIKSSTGKFVDTDSNEFYIINFEAYIPPYANFIVGSFVIPATRSWNSKPRDLTLNNSV